jgi:hypothetical protein
VSGRGITSGSSSASERGGASRWGRSSGRARQGRAQQGEAAATAEAKIQSLVDRGLLRPKAEVEWKAAVGEEFPTEDVKKQVVFASFFERIGEVHRGSRCETMLG